MKAILHFLGQERPLLNVKVQYYTYFEQWNGRPSSIPMGGLLWMELESAASDTILEERINTMDYDLYLRGYPTDKGKIIFYDENGDVLKRWKFNDAVIKMIKTRFEATGETPMTTTLEISAAIQEFGHLHVKWWKTSDVQEDTYKSPVVAEENKEPKILNGWWTKEKEDSQNLKKAKLGDTVYFHIETKNIKDGEEIDCKLYDLDKFIWDYLNPDDDKFNKKEVHKKVAVKNNKATIELLLNQGWEKNLKDDTAYDIELYWKVKYKDISKNLPKKQNSYLEVEFSDQTLFFNFPDPN
ncbi:type VI secretion system tube protein TssD [Tenacibaculum ovolyticum]|uniref:type VI secretion system tube protein TssD n=1 Tax=Tenacibaculum ovolyticum TaxID=104270 RepID=UPI000A9344AD|nr:type VI secretion system tube protein TssD [Tenacibaculum ovolyticum]